MERAALGYGRSITPLWESRLATPLCQASIIANAVSACGGRVRSGSCPDSSFTRTLAPSTRVFKCRSVEECPDVDAGENPGRPLLAVGSLFAASGSSRGRRAAHASAERQGNAKGTTGLYLSQVTAYGRLGGERSLPPAYFGRNAIRAASTGRSAAADAGREPSCRPHLMDCGQVIKECGGR